MDANELKDRLPATAVAFRGYELSNLGRSPELLAHRVYGPTVIEHLERASAACAELSGRKMNLVDRVRLASEPAVDSCFREEMNCRLTGSVGIACG